MADEKMCAMCGVKPPRKSDVWCNDCRNDYQKKYRNEREDQIARKAFQDGVKTMRHQVCQQLARYPGGVTTHQAIAEWIWTLPAPEYRVIRENGESVPQADREIAAP